jgi:hypothetical protein
MPYIPSLDEMPPAEWLEAMRGLRYQLVERAATVLDLHTTPQQAAPHLQELFDRYRVIDLGLDFGEKLPSRELSVEIQAHEDTLTVWVYPTESYESLVYTDHGHWWFDHRGPKNWGESRHELHRQVVSRLLDLLPWANDDDLYEMLAIEIGSRSGQ